MGNFFSSSQERQGEQDELLSLRSRLETVEESMRRASSRADTNGDGQVTRKEMEAYLATQLQVRQDELERLRSELERVQHAYDVLDAKHQKMLADIKAGRQVDVKLGSSVDDAAIDAFVQELIDDPNINIYGFPDRVEKAMYKRAAKMTLVGLEKVFENVALELIGHKVQLLMRPNAAEKVDDDEMLGE